MAMHNILPMQINAHFRIYLRIFVHYPHHSAFAVSAWPSLVWTTWSVLRFIFQELSIHFLDDILRMWKESILMPFSTVGRPKVHGGISGGSVFVALDVGS